MDADLDLVEVDGGTRLRLRVKPGARRDGIQGPHGGALKVSVTAPPDRGKANRAVIALLASLLDLPASSIALTSGESSRDKTVRIPLKPDDLRTRLAAAP